MFKTEDSEPMTVMKRVLADGGRSLMSFLNEMTPSLPQRTASLRREPDEGPGKRALDNHRAILKPHRSFLSSTCFFLLVTKSLILACSSFSPSFDLEGEV